jgi:aspartate/methionine/tyrosine aminotransferase
VICTYPGYQSLYEVARSIGCQVTIWQPDENQGWNFSIATLAEKFKANTRLVVANFPHNPTGHVPAQDEYEALVEIAREQGAYLLSDEMYRFLEVKPGTTLPSACELYKHAVSLFGLSKSFGLPGLRTGWLVTKDRELLEQVSRLKDYTTICSSAPSELLAIIALRSKQTILDQQNARLCRNIAVLESFMSDHQEIFRWNRPIGGSICFPRMLGIQDTFSFSEQLINETGILLAPSRVFQYGDHHVRIGYGRENLPLVLEVFGSFLDQLHR